MDEKHGKVLWRGGSGYAGTKGGWGHRCAYCNDGTARQAAPTKKKAEENFHDHLVRFHPGKLRGAGGR